MRKTALFLFSFLLLSLNNFSWAQTQNVKPESLLSKVSPSFPSPNAQAFGVFGSIPVSEFTGVPEINIPLHEVTHGDIVLPINLRYHTAHRRVDQMPSWVGLGWNLDVGGVITRNLRGDRDENRKKKSVGNGVGYQLGYLYNWPVWDRYNTSQPPELEGNVWYAPYFCINSNAFFKFDHLPDEFAFNFMDYSGTFYYDKNSRSFVVNSEHDIKVVFDTIDDCLYGSDINQDKNLSYSFQCFADELYIIHFRLITPDGMMYDFGGVDATEVSVPRQNWCDVNTVTSSWFLSKITSPNRLIQERAQNRVGGTDCKYYNYNFAGEVIAMLHEHQSTYQNITQKYTYTYDNQGRQKAVKHSLDNAMETTLAANTYDDLGRLSKKNQSFTPCRNCENFGTNYRYHIRGGLKSIVSDFFSETLLYDTETMGHVPWGSSHTPAYNGNITSKINTFPLTANPQEFEVYQYDYFYDRLDRLTQATFHSAIGDFSQPLVYRNSDNFSTTATYEPHGNLLTLSRMGIESKGIINPYKTKQVNDMNFAYAYAGNRLQSITDSVAGTTIPYYGKQTYSPNAPTTGFGYDSNGNVNWIEGYNTSIDYDLFVNKPSQIPRFLSTEYIKYDALGNKTLQGETRHISSSTMPEPIYIYYAGPVIYTREHNSTTPKTVHIELGDDIYYKDGEYYIRYTDYQGSTRVVVQARADNYNASLPLLPPSNSGSCPLCGVMMSVLKRHQLASIVEVNAYDPWGVEFGRADDPFGVQPFKHQGKERLNFEDMNVHDHGARWAFNAIGRWLSPDPLAEANYAVSPYAYCNNNPVRFTDPDGRMFVEDWVEDKYGKIYWDENAISQETTKEGEKYLGKNVLVGTHNRDINLNEPINSATFDLYLESNHDGPSATINGNTVPADGTKSGTLEEGLYPARFQGRASYLARGKTDLALIINEGGAVPTAYRSPKSFMTGIFFHAGNSYQTSLFDSRGNVYSEGCLTGPCLPGADKVYNAFGNHLKEFNGSLYLRGNPLPFIPSIDISLPGLNILKHW